MNVRVNQSSGNAVRRARMIFMFEMLSQISLQHSFLNVPFPETVKVLIESKESELSLST